MDKPSATTALCLLCFGMLTLTNVCECRNLSVHVPAYDARTVALGDDLMLRLGIRHGDVSHSVSTWTIPTSIVVNAMAYAVKFGDNEFGGFKLRSTAATNSVVARGYLRMAPDSNIARRSVFASITEDCSLQNYALSQGITVTHLGSNTNSMFIGHAKCRRGDFSYLIHRNLYMRITATTNSFDFATALMNAGLPEGERVPLNEN